MVQVGGQGLGRGQGRGQGQVSRSGSQGDDRWSQGQRSRSVSKVKV